MGTASMRPAPPRLDDRAELLALARERLNEPLDLLGEDAPDGERREMEGRRESVVRRLAEVDVVVGVYRRPVPARLLQDLRGAPGDRFVDVHVERDARSRLVDVHDELLPVLSRENLVARLDDRAHLLGVQPAHLEVRFGARRLMRA